MTATALPVASIVAYPDLDGVFLKERENDGYGSVWVFCDPSGARTAYDTEVDQALGAGATVLRDGS